jgi:DNA polymerase
VDSDFIKKVKLAAAKIEFTHGACMSAIADCLRGFLIPAKGKIFIGGDYSNIEGRVLAWLAGEEWKCGAFRQFDLGVGIDIYILAYAKSFQTSVEKVTDANRQIGKVQELSLGFGGGKGAFQNMAKNYGVKVSDSVADEIKTAWREAHPATVKFWYELENAATNAVLYPNKIFEAGAEGRRIKYKVAGSFLWCLLPSGRALCYPYPKIEPVMKPWGEMGDSITYMYVDSISNTWMRGSTYGGSLAENVTQATARDILTDAMLRIEDAGFPISFHVHDEIVTEIPVNNADKALPTFEKIMAEVPNWATGLPIAVKCFAKDRYGK